MIDMTIHFVVSNEYICNRSMINGYEHLYSKLGCIKTQYTLGIL